MTDFEVIALKILQGCIVLNTSVNIASVNDSLRIGANRAA